MANTNERAGSPPGYPRYWAEQILEAEHSDARFEDFAVAATAAISGEHVSGTSRSWDLGRDGRGLRPQSKLYVTASLDGATSKVRMDVGNLVEELRTRSRAMPETLYCFTTAYKSEHGVEELENAAREHLPDAQISVLGQKQIVDEVMSGRLAEVFAQSYAGELASLRLATAAPTENSAPIEHLQLALGTYASDGTGPLRDELQFRLLTRLLGDGPRTEQQLLGDAEQRYGIKTFSPVALTRCCEDLQRMGAVEDVGGNRWRLTLPGRTLLEGYKKEQAQTELQGNSGVRAGIEKSLGRALDDGQWKRVWLALQAEIADLCYQHGHELVQTIAAFLDGSKAPVSGETFSESLRKALQHTAAQSAQALMRPELEQALHDIFLPGNDNPAFEWLTRIAGTYVAACTLGLPQEVYTSVETALATVRFVFDSDVVISYLCPHEPGHDAARAIVEMAKRLNHPVIVPHAVAEEVARHAMKAHVDYDYQVRGCAKPFAWYEVEHLQSAFTREFEHLRMEGKVNAAKWPDFIAAYTGPFQRDAHGKLVPNVQLMRRILSNEGFLLLASGLGDQRWMALAKELADELAKERMRIDQGETVFAQAHDNKSRIDAELLVAVNREIETAEASGRSDRYVLVSSAVVLRRLRNAVAKRVTYVPDILSLSESVFLVGMLPNSPATARSMRALLSDGDFFQSLEGLSGQFLNILRQSESARIPGASRGALLAGFQEAIIRDAKENGIPRAEVAVRIRRDPVAFAGIAAAALDAHAIESRVEREDVLRRVEEALKGVKGDPNGRDR